MFAFRRILPNTSCCLATRRMTSLSIYDIQEKTIQESSPYKLKPSNVFDECKFFTESKNKELTTKNKELDTKNKKLDINT